MAVSYFLRTELSRGVMSPSYDQVAVAGPNTIWPRHLVTSLMVEASETEGEFAVDHRHGVAGFHVFHSWVGMTHAQAASLWAEYAPGGQDDNLSTRKIFCDYCRPTPRQ